MKIKNIYFLFCLTFLIFFGCKNKNLSSEVFSSNLEYQFFDDLGKLKYIANYNKNLLLTQLSLLNENEKLAYQTIKSPESGLITEERTFNKSGKLENITQYHYLPDGKLEKKEIISNSNKLLLSCSYKYNNEGKMTKIDIYNTIEQKNWNTSATVIQSKSNSFTHTTKTDVRLKWMYIMPMVKFWNTLNEF